MIQSRYCNGYLQLQRHSSANLEIQNVPTYKRAAIIQSSAHSCTISGSKNVLEGLRHHFRKLGLSGTRSVSLNGAHCAPFLALPSLDRIVGTSPCLDLRSSEMIQMVCASSGDLRCGDTLRGLLGFILPDILGRETRGEVIDESIANIVGNAPASLLVFGPTSSYSSYDICDGLSNIVIQYAYDDLAPASLQESGEMEDIAIVGLAGRFPGSEDLEGFWNVLREGRDLCQEVSRSRCWTLESCKADWPRCPPIDSM